VKRSVVLFVVVVIVVVVMVRVVDLIVERYIGPGKSRS
jgi:hypothetical protein